MAIMHTLTEDTTLALHTQQQHWTGPIGAYAHSGEFIMPKWQFIDVISPEDYAREALQWVEMGVRVIGGAAALVPSTFVCSANAYQAVSLEHRATRRLQTLKRDVSALVKTSFRTISSKRTICSAKNTLQRPVYLVDTTCRIYRVEMALLFFLVPKMTRPRISLLINSLHFKSSEIQNGTLPPKAAIGGAGKQPGTSAMQSPDDSSLLLYTFSAPYRALSFRVYPSDAVPSSGCSRCSCARSQAASVLEGYLACRSEKRPASR